MTIVVSLQTLPPGLPQASPPATLLGIVESIDEAKAASQDAWPMQAIQRGYELLGRYLGLFTDKLGVAADDRLMERLILARNVLRDCCLKNSRESRRKTTQRRSPID